MTTSKARLQANILSADGTLKATTIADNTITSDKIATGTIASIDLGDSAVTSLKIANGAIATVDLADGAVTAEKLASDVREFQFVNYTADSAQTTFAADSNPGSDNGLVVFLNGIFQTSGVNYTRANANVVFSQPLDSGDQVDIIRTSLVSEVIEPSTGSITPDMFSNQLQNIVTDRFTGNGTTSLFTLSEQPYNANGVLVFIDGVNQIPDVNYSVDSSAITFGSAPDSDADIFVSHITYRLGEYEITPSVGTVTEAAFSSEINFLNDGYLVVKSNSSDPVSPSVGQMYFNDSDDTGYFWTGSEWVAFTNNFSADGGEIDTYTDGGVSYQSHTFTSSGIFTISGAPSDVDVLVVAGGGGGGGAGAGGAGGGGGGGAGGMIADTINMSPGSYQITVGSGGAGGAIGLNDGVDGSNSVISSLTAIGGGGGGGSDDVDTARVGRDGGSGGGGGADDQGGNPVGSVGGSGTSGQGNNGGGGAGHTSGDLGGGGGGAGEAGQDNIAGNKAGDGGDGLQNNYRTGSNVYYAGGGGGGTNQGDGVGGLGGGGTGVGNGNESAGTANTGGGGGGARSSAGLNGGSGIVVIRYSI